MKYLVSICTLLSLNILASQTPVQNIRGSVIELSTNQKITSAKVSCITNDSTVSTLTDDQGEFLIKDIPVGRISFFISADGYLDKALTEIYLPAGKELILNIQLEEKIIMKTVSLKMKRNEKDKPLNTMTSVSGRQFSVEETQRFAAAANDPARMAMSYAGVVAADDGNNTIIVRGNNPNGLIWRMEGMDIPNPNHFSNAGTAGGGITILSAQVLANSDFMTSAFAAQYGNGLAGVFDLNLRKGNKFKHEHTIQMGVLGLDLASEGPLGKKGGSYLVNYRYSTLSMFGLMGIELGDGITNFQDLSYNVYLPINKKLSYSSFGFMGLSNQFDDAEKDSLLWKEESFKRAEWRFTANTIFAGNKLSYTISPKHKVEAKLGLSFQRNGYREQWLDSNYKLYNGFWEKFDQKRLTINLQSDYKISAKHLIRSGLIFENNDLGLNLQVPDSNDVLEVLFNQNAYGNTLRGFSQWRWRPSRKLTINAGLHAMHFLFNNANSLEPRIGMKYQLGKKSILSAGYGLHSQLLPIGTYYAKNDQGQFINKRLPFAKAHHYVIGFDQMFKKYWHFKTEVYLQDLFNQGVSSDDKNTFSMINQEEGFYSDSLYATGTGRNVGFELTLERFFSKGFYLLVNTSISRSTYTDILGREHNTAYNLGKTMNFTIGKEWKVGSNALAINFKALLMGGMSKTPINIPESIAKDGTVFNYDQVYSLNNPDYFRLDSRISYTINKGKTTRTWSLDLQNTTNRQNVGGNYFNTDTGKEVFWYQAPLLPILAYKFQF